MSLVWMQLNIMAYHLLRGLHHLGVANAPEPYTLIKTARA